MYYEFVGAGVIVGSSKTIGAKSDEPLEKVLKIVDKRNIANDPSHKRKKSSGGDNQVRD